MSRAAAVVAEHGSSAGHLASVAREFCVPALFGVSDAPRVLAFAGEVTVDADGRAVYAGRIPELLAAEPTAEAPPQESAVRRTLEELVRLVVPLSRITSYNVCYTKLLRESGHELAFEAQSAEGF